MKAVADIAMVSDDRAVGLVTRTEISPSSLKAVGFSLDFSGDERVSRIQALAAALITEMEIVRASTPSAAREASIAITDIEAAQLSAVKAATWK